MGSASWSRSPEQGLLCSEAGSLLSDGRHLGCGGSRSSSRRSGRRGPGWDCRRRSLERGCPYRAGVSSRRDGGSMTRGVRADRVGKKLSSGRPQGRRLGREAALERGRSWPVKSRLASEPAGSRRPAPGARKRARNRPARDLTGRRHPISVQGSSSSRGASVERAGGACEPRDSGAGERSARAHVRAARDGDQAVVWACSRIVVVAEVDERRLVQTERSGV
jgi:hypothetical protein